MRQYRERQGNIGNMGRERPPALDSVEGHHHHQLNVKDFIAVNMSFGGCGIETIFLL